MSKRTRPSTKLTYQCSACGAVSARWLGRCAECQAWNTLEETAVSTESLAPASKRQSKGSSKVQLLGEVEHDDAKRLSTGSSEFDRVLGGGAVLGGVVLLGGEPGIGKSTLLMQALAFLAHTKNKVLYVTGEESASQVALRGERLGLTGLRDVSVLASTDFEDVRAAMVSEHPNVVVIDSIQTVRANIDVTSGSPTHLRIVTEELIEIAKRNGIALFLVGHVTKDGAIAGPKALEHLVDTVLYFEGDRSHAFRIVRSIKNRFGPAHEIGVFEMVRDGLREVPEPSALFLAERPAGASGSVVVPTAEGSRPLLIEVQALVAPALYGGARRIVSGLDSNRLGILLAVLDRRVGLHVLDQDVFASVAGGAHVDERALDLGLALAVVSSFRNIALEQSLVVLGEIGLAGEVRAVPRAGLRIAEARKLGFTKAILPMISLDGMLASEKKGIELFGVKNVEQAINIAFNK